MSLRGRSYPTPQFDRRKCHVFSLHLGHECETFNSGDVVSSMWMPGSARSAQAGAGEIGKRNFPPSLTWRKEETRKPTSAGCTLTSHAPPSTHKYILTYIKVKSNF